MGLRVWYFQMKYLCAAGVVLVLVYVAIRLNMDERNVQNKKVGAR